MSCTVYIVSYNFTIHATFLSTFMAYKYIEFQISRVIQKLSCNELHQIYSELQFYNSCNLFVNTHGKKIQ